jgi:hypothetical protein
VRLQPQVRAAFPCAARDTSEAAARQVSAGSKRGVQPRVHAVVSDVLYWLRVAWCALHALYRVRAACAAVTFLRSCMRWGMALGWTRSRGDL